MSCNLLLRCTFFFRVWYVSSLLFVLLGLHVCFVIDVVVLWVLCFGSQLLFRALFARRDDFAVCVY